MEENKTKNKMKQNKKQKNKTKNKTKNKKQKRASSLRIFEKKNTTINRHRFLSFKNVTESVSI